MHAGNVAAMAPVADRPRVGALLRDWRRRRRLSQLDLALEAGVSARHLSFVETGRSRPSAEMVLHLAEQLDVPLRDRNQLLLAAGYAPALRRSAASTSRRWGRCARRSTACCAGTSPTRRSSSTATGAWSPATAPSRCSPTASRPSCSSRPSTCCALSLHPEGVAPRIVNLGEWRAHLLDRLGRQAVVDRRPRAGRALRRARRLPRRRRRRRAPETSAAGEIAVPLRLRTGDARARRSSARSTTFGTAIDITVAELSIESFFPADAATAAFLHA